YAWESADSGDEAAPTYVLAADRSLIPIRSGALEHHISADIAFAVWRYWQATGDDAFLLDAGAEIILETARFWSSRASRDDDGFYHIRNVIGPDEYHDDVDDNAFTNGMACWHIRCGLALARLLEEKWPRRWSRLSDRLGLTGEEQTSWEQVSE